MTTTCRTCGITSKTKRTLTADGAQHEPEQKGDISRGRTDRLQQLPVQRGFGACPACPYCGQSFENTNPAGTLPVNTLLAGRYTIGRVLALDGEGVLYAAIDNSATRRVVIKEYVPVTICAARSRDGSVIPRQGREVLFKTTRMDFVDLYRSLVALGRNDGLVQVLDLIEENNTAYAVREPDEGTPLLTYLEQRPSR